MNLKQILLNWRSIWDEHVNAIILFQVIKPGYPDVKPIKMVGSGEAWKVGNDKNQLYKSRATMQNRAQIWCETINSYRKRQNILKHKYLFIKTQGITKSDF